MWKQFLSICLDVLPLSGYPYPIWVSLSYLGILIQSGYPYPSPALHIWGSEPQGNPSLAFFQLQPPARTFSSMFPCRCLLGFRLVRGKGLPDARIWPQHCSQSLNSRDIPGTPPCQGLLGSLLPPLRGIEVQFTSHF